MRELTAATVLALHALHLMLKKNKPVTLKEIRRSSGFGIARVRPVIGKLRHAGLIRRRSGHGYMLSKAPGEISIRDVVQAVDEAKPPTSPCGGDYDACDSRASCIFAPLCRHAEQGFQETLRSFTLAELVNVPLDLPNCLDPKVRVEAS